MDLSLRKRLWTCRETAKRSFKNISKENYMEDFTPAISYSSTLQNPTRAQSYLHSGGSLKLFKEEASSENKKPMGRKC
jgi:hypothetical protein